MCTLDWYLQSSDCWLQVIVQLGQDILEVLKGNNSNESATHRLKWVEAQQCCDEHVISDISHL